MKRDIVRIIFIVTILAIVGAYFLYAPEVEPEFGVVELSGGSIIVEDQADPAQIILYAELVETGFVTVHKSMGVAPGETIAISMLLEPGIYDRLLLTPSSELILGDEYITLLHVDDGNGIFDISADKPVSVNGEVVRPSFIVITSK